MTTPLERTLAALELTELGGDVYQVDPGPGRHRLYGGLVAAQAVVAAESTVGAEHRLHSLHATFLRPGTPGTPIRFAVGRTKDGGSYAMRQVTASQEGNPILSSFLSFARPEVGLEQQILEMPSVPGPESLPNMVDERVRRYREDLGVELPSGETAVEVRLCDSSMVEPQASARPEHACWMRIPGDLSTHPHLQRALLVYASDRPLVATARMPYELGVHQLMSTSLDHALWIHHEADISDWHLYEMQCPASSSGRGLVVAHLYRPDGVCVATVTQQCLVRVARSSK